MLAELQIQVEPNRMAEVETKAKSILTGLGFSKSQWSKPLSTLSGGMAHEGVPRHCSSPRLH